MLLRPIGFSIPSTTQLSIVFSENVSKLLTIENFNIESLNGAVSNLEVRGVSIDGDNVLVETSQQVEGNYYLLRLVDSEYQLFLSESGKKLVNDSVSRELFFIGIDTLNPSRDRMLKNIPTFFEIENTNIKSILSTEGREIFGAQKALGGILSDNYISESVIDEPRIRTSGAFDRFANEQVFEIERVSRNLTNQNLKLDSIKYTESSEHDSLSSFPYYPVSLQQRIVIDEEVVNDGNVNSFSGFLLNLENKNILRLLSVKLIRTTDQEDCFGSIGVDYNLEKYKYSINDNFYDPEFSFSNSLINNNQILLSQFGNLEKPSVNDRFIVSYLYKDLSRSINIDLITVSNVEFSENETLPSNSVRFFLKNAPIVNSSNENVTMGGVTFHINENNSQRPAEFQKELKYNVSKLPKLPGEYSINYETGEVFLVGSDNTYSGTGRNYYVCNYNYRNVFVNNLDYSISSNDIVAMPNRGLALKQAEIFLKYEEQFVEGVDYNALIHKEVMPEFVENRIKDSFTIESKNYPITNVFRIFNQTTGEVYTPNGFSDTEIFFTGRRSPEIKSSSVEQANFDNVTRESLEIIGELISPVQVIKIIGNISNNNIEFSPPIPAEFIDINSDNYYIRYQDSDLNIEDINIKFFGNPDGENLISSFAINLDLPPPTIGLQFTFGLKTYIVNLQNDRIINSSGTALSSILSSSVVFEDSYIFKNEKYFIDSNNSGDVQGTSENFKLALVSSKDDVLYKNVSKLRKTGDYCIDSRFGIVYVAVSKNQEYDLKTINYTHGTHNSVYSNIITTTNSYKKINISDDNILNEKTYFNFENSNNSIDILDLESGLQIFDNITEANAADGSQQLICTLLDDYTCIVPNSITDISSIVMLQDLTGNNLNSSSYNLRLMESSKEDLLKSYKELGKNLYDKDDVSFSSNVIDFKKTTKRNLYRTNSTLPFTVSINDEFAGLLLNVVNAYTGDILFDESLNINKILNVYAVSVTNLITESNIVISSQNSLNSIDSNEDFYVDSSGNQFSITSFNSFTNNLTVSLPAINADIYTVASGLGSVIVKASVTYTGNGIDISIPGDAPVSNGDSVIISYITDGVPSIGDALVIDCNYGNIYIDYMYLFDNLVIWYEYGNSSIDWSIGRSLYEGEQYFVSYKYGALREALQNNFGSLTNLPYFTNLSLDIDREIYRNALRGVLQSYPKGPVISSYKNLVKSITDIEPDIKELAFDQWILGRDILSPGYISHSGDLKFKNAKFGSGLYIEDGTTVTVPAVSSLSIREGSVDTWISPEWSGIDDDASITFNLDNIGTSRLLFAKDSNVLQNGWKYGLADAMLESDTFGKHDFSSTDNILYSYNTFDEEHTSATSSLRRPFNNLNIATKNLLEVKCKINKVALVNNAPLESIDVLRNIALLGINDGYKTQVISFNLSAIHSSIPIQDAASSYPELPTGSVPTNIQSCKCSVENNIDILEKYSDLQIKIEFASPITLSQPLNNLANDAFLSSVQSYCIVDAKSMIFQVTALKGISGKLYTSSLPNEEIIEAYLKKQPLHPMRVISGMLSLSDINGILPSDEIKFFAKSISIGDEQETQYCVDWSIYHKYSIKSDAQNNSVTIFIDNDSVTRYYSDTICNNNIDNSLFGYTNILSSSGDMFISATDNYLSEFSFSDIKTVIDNKLTVNDIYIGANSYNPKKIPFTVNKQDYPLTTVGAPKNIEYDEGIFIYYDDICKSPLLNELGQWVMRTTINKMVKYPLFVRDEVSIYDYRDFQFSITGKITTDGEFGSVVRPRRDSFGDCASESELKSMYRFCGNSDLKNGWVKIEDSNSDLINVISSGTQTQYSAWKDNNSFESLSASGLYRISSNSIVEDCDSLSRLDVGMYTKNPRNNSNIEYKVSLKVISSELYSNLTKEFDDEYSGRYSDISPIFLSDDDFRVKISFGINDASQNFIIISDYSNMDYPIIIKVIPYQWSDSVFNEFKIIKDKDNNLFYFYINDYAYYVDSLTSFDSPIDYNIENFIAIQISSLESMAKNIVDIDLIEFLSTSADSLNILEDTDVIIDTDNEIFFEFNLDQLDGYLDDLNDGYDGYDGYGEYLVSDELLFNSDKLRYILDCGADKDSNRFSLFKDGKGFLNFRVYSEKTNNDANFYNISTNIKSFKKGELHHIAISWKLGTFDERDEMHLFIDGQEAPNIYKFGGKIPASLNEKFSDISKEQLKTFTFNQINYCEEFAGGTITATTSIFQSIDAQFSNDMIGRAIMFIQSNIADSLLNKQYIIKQVLNSHSVILCSGENSENIVFSTSASDILWSFAPHVGVDSQILTDLNNAKFSVVRIDKDNIKTEYVGLLYKVVNNKIVYLNYDNIRDSKYRANVNSRVIEFIGNDLNCEYVPSIDPLDLNVYIKTFGLNIERAFEKISLSSNTYDSESGLNFIRTRGAEPTSLLDVDITRVILDTTLIDIDSVDNLLSTFNIDLSQESSKLSSENILLTSKNNRGRLLTVIFESDNINYCLYDGYQDGYQDGYLDGQNNTITVYGTTTDGINEETFFITGNGQFSGKKYFTSVDSVSGTFDIIDNSYYDVGTISIEESDPVAVQNNSGDYAEIYEYKNGRFMVSFYGTSGSIPYELPLGIYKIDYPAYLKISLNDIGKNLFIGTDIYGENALNSTLDEFRILNEMVSDTKDGEYLSTSVKSITQDYNRSNQYCADKNTTFLSHFDDPIDLQSRTLRNVEFLDTFNNIKYTLSTAQREALLGVISSKSDFIKIMKTYGFTDIIAENTFDKVSMAESGPLFNEANFYNNYSDFKISSTSVNDSFKKSGIFTDSGMIVENNSGIFRKDEGTIEMWVSPQIDSDIDDCKRYYFDAMTISESIFESSNSNTIFLSSAAKEIKSIKLLNNLSKNKQLISTIDNKNIIYDEITRSSKTGLLEGGTGVFKDFASGSVLSADGLIIHLKDSLPGSTVKVIVSYIPKSANGDRISIYKDESSNLIFNVKYGEQNISASFSMIWKKNTWHKISASYKFNSKKSNDNINLVIDGTSSNSVIYGTGLLFGDGYIYGQGAGSQSIEGFSNIKIVDDFNYIAFGSDIYNENISNSRLDNIRLSRINRNTIMDVKNNFIDLEYSSNINAISPVLNDDATTFLENFDSGEDIISKVATIRDPENGIFDFEVNVIDNFNKVINVNDGNIELLVKNLINNIKPAHTNAYIKFKKSNC